MNLADSTNCAKFSAMLTTATTHLRFLSDWEEKFVTDMEDKFSERETQVDLGMTPWNPTVNQWNTLHGIVSKL